MSGAIRYLANATLEGSHLVRHHPGKPNVIVFFTDQQRWDSTGLHGNPLELTPNLDRVARAGTHVAYSFTNQPVCGPARSSMQTGMYATATGCWRNGIPLDSSLPTLANHFREAGYRTGYIGKWHLAASEPVAEAERGAYQDWLAANLLEFASGPYDARFFDGNGDTVELPGYRVDAQTDAAIRYIDAHKEEPFFLFCSYLEPHHDNRVDDYPAPLGYRERYEARWTPPDLTALGGTSQQHLPGYWGMVKRLDEAFGRLMDALHSLDLTDNTIVLFTSDHGNHFKTRNNEYKRSCHDASIRMPTVFMGSGFRGGGQVQDLVSLVDLPPTLLDAAGIPAPKTMQGRSIMPLIRHEPDADWPQEVFVQISEAEVARAIRTKRWKYHIRAEGADPWRDPGSDTYTEHSLFDLQVDPYELNNLIGFDSHRALCDRLKERLIRRMVEAGEATPMIENAPARKSSLFLTDHELTQ